MREAATGNALSPTIDRRVGVSADDDDLSRGLELMSATYSSRRISLRDRCISTF